MDPRPALIRFPNGMEQMGIAISEDVVEVAEIGLFMELYDIIEVDGAPRQVSGINTQMSVSLGSVPFEGGEMATRLKHRPLPTK